MPRSIRPVADSAIPNASVVADGSSPRSAFSALARISASGVRNSWAISREKRRSRSAAVYSRCKAWCSVLMKGASSRGRALEGSGGGWPGCSVRSRSLCSTNGRKARRTSNRHSTTATATAAAMIAIRARWMRRSARSQAPRSVATTSQSDVAASGRGTRNTMARPG